MSEPITFTEADFETPSKITFSEEDFAPKTQTTSKPNLLDKLAGYSPEELKQIGTDYYKAGNKQMGDVALAISAFQSAGKDLLTIPAHYVNQLLLNYPRSLTKKAGMEYPEKAENPLIQKAAQGAGVAGALASPVTKVLGGVSQAPLRTKALTGAAIGAAYAPENVDDWKQRGIQALIGGSLPVVGAGIGKIGKNAPRIPNLFRGGLSKEEVIRLNNEYGASNAGLVDKIKSRVGEKISSAETAYQTAMNNAPKGKQINIRPAIEEAGKRLKRLGLITDNGNLTELGNSEIARDSVYGKMLDFYKSADSISGIGKLANKESLTSGQMIKWQRAQRETLVNKEQFAFLRDKLNSLYKNKPSDIDVNKIVNQFYQDGESGGIKGLQEARKLTRKAYLMEERFLNKNTGDLKIATEGKLSKIGTKNPLSKQELDHIRELEQYIGFPIEKEATNINKLNKALERIKNIKTYGGVAVGGAVAGELGRKIVTGSF